MTAFAGFLLCSTVLWGGRMPSMVSWSFLEALAGILFLRRLVKNSTWILPARPVALAWGLAILWCALSLSWTANFHATLTSLHKMILITLLSALFLNEREDWEASILKSASWTGALCAVVWILFPLTARTWSPTPSLTAGFMALSAVLAFGKIPFFLASPAVFLTSSLGAALAWAGGIFLQSRRKISRAAVIFSALLILASALPLAHNSLFDIWKRKMDDRYTTERLSIWKDSAAMFLAHPVRGVGLGSFSDAYPKFKSIPGLRNAPYAHNEIMNTLCETGLIGGVLGLGLIICILKNRPRSSVWVAAALAALIQSLFDFNLRYAPVTVLFTFCVCTFVPIREPVVLKNSVRNALAVLAVLWTILAVLPGAAALVYVQNPGKNAAAAIALDPFNGIYRAHTGRMRDLDIAIALEPGNVWYRRRAALFYLSDWKNSGNPASLELAESEYQKILKLAPNVAEFQEEYKKFFNH